MQLFFLLFFVGVSSLHAFVDLGLWGTQYDIKENFEFKEPSTPIVNDNTVQQAYKKALKSNQQLPECIKSHDRKMNPTVVLDHDINMPKYNLFIKKGTSFNYLDIKKLERYMIMIDGSNPQHVEFAQYYKAVADIIIYNGNTEVFQDWSDGHIYIADESFQKAFQVKCLPSVYTQETNQFLIREYNIKELVAGEANEKK